MTRKKRLPRQSRPSRAVAKPPTVQNPIPPDYSRTTPQRTQNRGAAVRVEGMSYSGLVPPPEFMRGYNEEMTDGANRILAMAERQETHRQWLEKYVVKGDSRRSWTGLIILAAFLAGILYVSWDATMAGRELGGGILGSVGVVAITSIFIYGLISRRRERQQRVEWMMNERSDGGGGRRNT